LIGSSFNLELQAAALSDLRYLLRRGVNAYVALHKTTALRQPMPTAMPIARAAQFSSPQLPFTVR
jgi:hypothetical protein